jgi:HEAT repeat protein
VKTATSIGLCLLLILAGGQVHGQRDKKGKDVAVAGKSIGEWSKALEGKDALPRVQAINALVQAGPEARRAVPALIGVFRDKDSTFLHPLAAVALSRIGTDAVTPLQKALKDENFAVRGGAALALGLIGAAARPAVSELATTLKDRESLVRSAAAVALGRIGALARGATLALRAALADSDRTVRVESAAALWRVSDETRGVDVLAAALKEDGALAERAASVLAEIGPRAKSVTGALKSALAAKSVRLRIAAAEAYYRVTKDAGSPLPVLEALIGEKDPGDRLAAVAALGSLGAEMKAATLLAGLLRSKDADVRREAACALAERGSSLKESRAALEEGLADRDTGVRWWCALALASDQGDIRKQEEELLRIFRAALLRIGDREPGKGIQDVQAPASARAVPALVDVLKNRPGRLRLEAARSLGHLGIDVRVALPELLDALKGDDKAVRRAAAEAIGTMGAEALPVLIRLLGNADGRLREGAARALGQMGLPARSALPALLRLAKDPEPAVQTQVALAIWNIDQKAEEALPILRAVMVDVDNKDRWEAMEAVGTISVQASPPIRGLTTMVVSALKDRNARVRVQAAKWLFRRERQARLVVPLLRDGVNDRDVAVRIASVEGLGELGAEARVAPLLTTALEDRDLSVRLTAEEALARGGADSVPQLIEALKSTSAKVRVGVVRALGLMGPAAKEAMKVLEGLKGDPNKAVSKAAVLAMWEIGPMKTSWSKPFVEDLMRIERGLREVEEILRSFFIAESDRSFRHGGRLER